MPEGQQKVLSYLEQIARGTRVSTARGEMVKLLRMYPVDPVAYAITNSLQHIREARKRRGAWQVPNGAFAIGCGPRRVLVGELWYAAGGLSEYTRAILFTFEKDHWAPSDPTELLEDLGAIVSMANLARS